MTDRLLTNLQINTALILFTLVLTSTTLGLLFGKDLACQTTPAAPQTRVMW